MLQVCAHPPPTRKKQTKKQLSVFKEKVYEGPTQTTAITELPYRGQNQSCAIQRRTVEALHCVCWVGGRIDLSITTHLTTKQITIVCLRVGNNT